MCNLNTWLDEIDNRKYFIKSCRKKRRSIKARIRKIGESDIPMRETLTYRSELLSCMIAEFGGGLAYTNKKIRR